MDINQKGKKMRYLLYLFFVVLFLPTIVDAAELPECKWGADPVNKNRQVSSGEQIQIAPAGTVFHMQTARNKKGVVCKSVDEQPVVVDYTTGLAKWVLKCGNPILNKISFKQRVQLADLSAVDNYLLTRKAPEYTIVPVHACGPGTVCWARAQQFRLSVNLGASVHKEFGKWSGYRPDNYNLTNSQNQDQKQEAKGGSGGNGYGGAGGSGGSSNAENNNSNSNVNNNNNGNIDNGGPIRPEPPIIDPGPGGPERPNDPNS